MLNCILFYKNPDERDIITRVTLEQNETIPNDDVVKLNETQKKNGDKTKRVSN